MLYGLIFDMRFSTSPIPLLQYAIMQTVCIQSVPGGSVTILEGHGFGHSKQK